MILMIYENDSYTNNHKFIELCLSTNYFIFEIRVTVLENARTIGLALITVISEGFLQHINQ